MSEMDNIGYRRLAAAILLAAVEDLHGGDVVAQVSAWRFVRSDWGRYLADSLDVAPETWDGFIIKERLKIRSVAV